MTAKSLQDHLVAGAISGAHDPLMPWLRFFLAARHMPWLPCSPYANDQTVLLILMQHLKDANACTVGYPFSTIMSM